MPGDTIGRMRRTVTYDDLGRLPLPGMDAPTRFAFSADGAQLAYLHAGDGTLAASLWLVDVLAPAPRVVMPASLGRRDEQGFDREEALRRERMRERSLGVTAFHWAAESPTLCVPVPGGATLLGRNGVLHRLELGASTDPRIAPRADAIAWVSGGELWSAVIDAGGMLGDRIRHTTDATEEVSNGLADFVAAEELGRYRGHWWNAAGDAIAFARVDTTAIPPFHIQHLAAERPEMEVHRYPFAGGPNAVVRLRVARAGRGAAVDVDLGADAGDYLARVVAEPAGTWLVAVLPRSQTSLRWLRVDADGTARELWTERSEPWLNLDDDTRALPDGRVLRSTEASGHRHLMLRAPDGAVERVLTAGDWDVTGVAGVDLGRGAVLFHATRDGVLDRHLYAVPLDAGSARSDPERMTTDAGWHEAVAAGNGTWVDRWSSRMSAPRVVLRRPDGTSVSIHEPGSSAAELGRTPPRLDTVRAADGVTDLNVAYYAPAADAPTSSPPPAVLWVYGGPHSQKVANQWELTALPWRALVTQLGAAVVVVDNRGTAHRGVAFEAALAGALGTVEVDDQLAAIDQLAARGLLDAGRVAITGGSYGGYLTIRALLRYPDRFIAGVAWAPVVDWEGYDSAYSERYLGAPAEHALAYRDASLRHDVGRLRAPLLVQHGLLDENVHIHHTARLLDALAAAGVTCDLQLFPGERHIGRAPAAVRTRDRRAIEYLARALGLQPLDDRPGSASDGRAGEP